MYTVVTIVKPFPSKDQTTNPIPSKPLSYPTQLTTLITVACIISILTVGQA